MHVYINACAHAFKSIRTNQPQLLTHATCIHNDYACITSSLYINFTLKPMHAHVQLKFVTANH